MAKKTTLEYIIVNGIKIQANSVYEIVPKQPSEGAPEHLRKLGSEKVSSPYVTLDGKEKSLISNMAGFPFIDNRWDTGFYPESGIFKRMGLGYEDADSKAKTYKFFIVDFLREKGHGRDADKLEDPDLLNDNELFFDNLMAELWEGRQFNTAVPKDRLHLYMAILAGELAQGTKPTQEDLELGIKPMGDGVYSYAQYAVTSKELVKNVAQKKEYENSRAIGVLFNLLESDKKLLVDLANYEGVKIDIKDEDMVINQSMKIYFESFDNVKSFLETYDSYKQDKSFKELLEIMSLIRDKQALRKLQKEGRSYFLNNKNLGSTEKQIAKTIVNDATLLEEFFKLTA